MLLPSTLNSSYRIDGNDISNAAAKCHYVARSLHEETSEASGFEGQDRSNKDESSCFLPSDSPSSVTNRCPSVRLPSTLHSSRQIDDNDISNAVEKLPARCEKFAGVASPGLAN